jgi:hypothetical protein
MEQVENKKTCHCAYGRAETCGRPGQANNLAPLQTGSLKKYVRHLLSQGWEKLIFYSHLHFARNVRSRVWKPELTVIIFPISSDVLAPLIG